MASQWYYLVNNEQQGPVSSAELKQMATAGQIQPDTLIWKEGLDDWVSAQRIKGLFDAATETSSVEMTAQAAQAAESQQQPAAEGYDQQGGYQQPGYGGYGQQAAAYQNPHFPYAPNQLTGGFRNWLIVVICAFVFYLIGIVMMVVGAQSNPNDPPVAGLLIIMIGGLLALASVVLGCILLYRCWNSVQDLPARTTPGKAVGFMFIPFFNLYWMFVSLYGLAQDMETYCQQRGIQCHASTGIALTFCIISIVSIVPFVGMVALVNYVLGPSMLWQFAKTASRIAAWHRGEQSY